MIQDFWTALLKKDQALFSVLNGQWTNAFLDSVLPWFRTSNNWIPFYVALLAYLFLKAGVNAWKWLVMVIINVAVTDQLSSNMFKPFVHRLRPCSDPLIMHQARFLLDRCPSSFSFTSSHAANHFGLAMFIFMTLQPLFKKYTFLFFVWAGIISYAQVYVGVHYPLDIVAGTCIGLMIGYISSKIFMKWQGPQFI